MEGGGRWAGGSAGGGVGARARPGGRRDGPSGQPSAARTSELVEAARLADYGNSPGWLGSLFYMLYVPARRRTLKSLLRKTERDRDKALEETSWAYLECGRRLHKQASRHEFAPLQNLMHRVDHSVLREQQLQHERGKKKEQALASARVETAYRKLAEEALKRGLDQIDRDATGLIVAASRKHERLVREVRLRKLGIDLHDKGAVRRGTTVLLLLLAFIAVAAAFLFHRA